MQPRGGFGRLERLPLVRVSAWARPLRTELCSVLGLFFERKKMHVVLIFSLQAARLLWDPMAAKGEPRALKAGNEGEMTYS